MCGQESTEEDGCLRCSIHEPKYCSGNYAYVKRRMYRYACQKMYCIKIISVCVINRFKKKEISNLSKKCGGERGAESQ